MEKCNCKCEVCKTTLENMALELVSTKKLAEENLNLAKYQKAEFENYKKRSNHDVENAKNETRIGVITRMLGILDLLEFGMKQVTDKSAQEGLKKIFDAAEQEFTFYGVETIKVKPGDQFDPFIHESMFGAGSVIEEELQRGYRIDKRVLRPTKVKLK